MAAAIAMSGCGAKSTTPTTEAQKETTQAETTVVERVDGTAESVDESVEQAASSIRIWGSVSHDEDGKLVIDNQSGVSSEGEIVLNTSEETVILDAVTGDPMSAEDLKDGETIYAYISEAMTMSLPPQTSATVIFANIPQDFKAPDYITVKNVMTDASSSKVMLNAQDGTSYEIGEDCEITPYLTRNIVTVDDLTEGRTCVVWSDSDNVASKILVFAQ